MQNLSLFEKAKKASHSLPLLSDDIRNNLLAKLADTVEAKSDELLEANKADLARMNPTSPLYDRLMLTHERIRGIAADMRQVSCLPSPLGRTLLEKTLPNGLRLRRVSVPFGVIGIVFEARPNVCFDVFSLCFKSGNACVLKGGHDAEDSNKAIVALIQKTLCEAGIDPNAVSLLPATHEATAEMLQATGYIDLCIPRGGKRLITFVRDHARIPVIETGAGVVNTYFDLYGDLAKGTSIIFNAKTRRVSVCNALDCLIIHQSRLTDIAQLCAPLAAKNVMLYADEASLEALIGHYPAHLLSPATDDSYGTEYMDYKMAIRTVNSMEEALDHITKHGSGHSESIITEDAARAETFQMRVDAACVYVNAPTSFTDGAQFGLGAEIGISTQKLGPRGPMALEEMTTYKWLINGNGQVRNP